MSIKHSIFVLITILILTSCANLKSYERVYVNDPDMKISDDSGQNFQNYVTAIREGATPAGSSKSSGGCGCN